MLSPCTCFPFFTVVFPLIRRPLELQDVHHLVVPINCHRVRPPMRVASGGWGWPSAGVGASCGGGGTSGGGALPGRPRGPHAMRGAACCVRVWCLGAAGRACGAGPAAAGAVAGLAGVRCGVRRRLRLVRCVLGAVRNEARPRTFRALAGLDYRDTPRLGQCNYVELIDTIFTDVEGVD